MSLPTLYKDLKALNVQMGGGGVPVNFPEGYQEFLNQDEDLQLSNPCKNYTRVQMIEEGLEVTLPLATASNSAEEGLPFYVENYFDVGSESFIVNYTDGVDKFPLTLLEPGMVAEFRIISKTPPSGSFFTRLIGTLSAQMDTNVFIRGGVVRGLTELVVGGNGAADNFASLEIKGSKALYIPRLTTTSRNALTPQNGFVIYNTTTGQHEFYQGGAWVALEGEVGTISLDFSGAFIATGMTVYYSRSGKKVTLILPDVLNTVANATFLSSTLLPAALRPVYKVDPPVRVTDAGSQPLNPGLLRIATSGLINVFKDLNGGSFSTGAMGGLQSYPVSYITA
jgi:hypothetical protein